MITYVFYGIGIVCALGAIQERKDLLRMIGFLCVALIFVVLGWYISVLF